MPKDTKLENGTLSELPQGVVASADDLSTMHLGTNRFTEFTGRFPILKILHLGENLIRECPMYTTLVALNLGKNVISHIPDEIGTLVNLQSLIIGTNNIRTLPASINELGSLRNLQIYNNPLTDINIPNLYLNDLHVIHCKYLRGIRVKRVYNCVTDTKVSGHARFMIWASDKGIRSDFLHDLDIWRLELREKIHVDISVLSTTEIVGPAPVTTVDINLPLLIRCEDHV